MTIVVAVCCAIITGASLYVAALVRKVALRFYEVCDVIEKKGMAPVRMGRMSAKERWDRALSTLQQARDKMGRASE